MAQGYCDKLETSTEALDMSMRQCTALQEENERLQALLKDKEGSEMKFTQYSDVNLPVRYSEGLFRSRIYVQRPRSRSVRLCPRNLRFYLIKS